LALINIIKTDYMWTYSYILCEHIFHLFIATAELLLYITRENVHQAAREGQSDSYELEKIKVQNYVLVRSFVLYQNKTYVAMVAESALDDFLIDNDISQN